MSIEPLLAVLLLAASAVRAQDEAALTEIYRTIDKLEKTKVEVKEFHTYDELFPHFLLPGLAALVLGVILESTVFLKIP